ncbi:MAG: hypothetical protein R6U98_36640 [Pirellulaceae bacterium]
MQQAKLKPVVFILETDQHAGRFAVTGDDYLFVFRVVQNCEK